MLKLYSLCLETLRNSNKKPRRKGLVSCKKVRSVSLPPSVYNFTKKKVI